MTTFVLPGPPVAAPALQAIGLSKRYGRRDALALDRVDLAIAPGSITALIGPNGAGKSTLIRSFLGFETPSAGSVRVEGVDPRRRPGEAIRRLGYVSQSVGLYRGLSVAANLGVAGSLRPGLDVAGAAARLERLGIPLTRRAGDLSGGQQAQVALSIALATRAPILVLDEPLASLDPLARHEVLVELATAIRDGRTTTLLSSHIVSDIEAVCDAIVVLGAGRVLLAGGVAAVRAAHRIDPDGGTAGAGLVARIARPDGGTIALLRSDEPGLREPTLDELVLGYLAVARPRAAAGDIAS